MTLGTKTMRVGVHFIGEEKRMADGFYEIDDEDFELLKRIHKGRTQIVSVDLIYRTPAAQLRHQADELERQEADDRAFGELIERIAAERRQVTARVDCT